MNTLQKDIKNMFDLDVPTDIVDLIVNYYVYVAKDVLKSYLFDNNAVISYDFSLYHPEKERNKMLSMLSYEEKDVSFSDRNIFPVGCIIKMTRLLV